MNPVLEKKKVQVVVIAKDQLLRLKFNAKKSGHMNGFQNITGSVEENETFLEGAHREVIEEIGLDAHLIELDFEFSFKDRWGHEVKEKSFLFFLDHTPQITLSDEHELFEWKPITEIKSEDFLFPSNFEAFTSAIKICHSRGLIK